MYSCQVCKSTSSSKSNHKIQCFSGTWRSGIRYFYFFFFIWFLTFSSLQLYVVGRKRHGEHAAGGRWTAVLKQNKFKKT